jgi:hypothetical protein
MQRAAASSPTIPKVTNPDITFNLKYSGPSITRPNLPQDSSSQEPSSKRRKLSTPNGSQTPSTPTGLTAINAALEAEEKLRGEALRRQAEMAGETEWVLEGAVPEVAVNGAGGHGEGMRVFVRAGWAEIDGEDDMGEGVEDNESGGEEEEEEKLVGRKAFGKFKRKKDGTIGVSHTIHISPRKTFAFSTFSSQPHAFLAANISFQQLTTPLAFIRFRSRFIRFRRLVWFLLLRQRRPRRPNRRPIPRSPPSRCKRES